ncbi:MAG: tetratricopeptide repeat protein, partial [Deltaproteobacteria bacterium]|nr:tetratricopeptide repeat protein [Deltaproteobacteria bacterium]
RAGRPDEALSTLKRLLKQDPDNAAALNHVGYALVEKADAQSLEQAEPMLRRAVELRPDDGAVADSYGLCLLRRGRIAQALPELKRADALSPGDPIILSHLGDAQLASGLRAEAEETFKRSLSRLQPAASKRRSKKLEPQVDGEGDPDRAPDVQDAQVRVQLEAKLRALKSPQP